MEIVGEKMERGEEIETNTQTRHHVHNNFESNSTQVCRKFRKEELLSSQY